MLPGRCLWVYIGCMPETPAPRPPKGGLHLDSNRSPAVLTVNQVVAYNIARARRALGWTQADTAARLEETTGKPWSAATLGASERSFDGGRVREFDANELVAFSIVFGQPVAYFFIPPDLGETTGIYFLDNRIAGLGGAAGSREKFVARGMSEMDLLAKAVPLKFSAQFVSDVNRVLALGDLIWSPGRSRVEGRRKEDTGDWSDAVAARDRAGNVGADVNVEPVLAREQVGESREDRRLRSALTEAFRYLGSEESVVTGGTTQEAVLRELRRLAAEVEQLSHEVRGGPPVKDDGSNG